MATLPKLKLSQAAHRALEALARAGTVEARLARRARTVLLLGTGHSVRVTAERVGLAPRMVQHWKRRFLEHGVAGLEDAPRPGRPKVIPLRKEARILADTQRRPPGPERHSARAGSNGPGGPAVHRVAEHAAGSPVTRRAGPGPIICGDG